MTKELVERAQAEARYMRRFNCLSQWSPEQVVAYADALESQSQELARLRGEVERLRSLLGRVNGCLNNAFAAGTEEREFGSARRQGKLMDKVEAFKADVSAALSGEGE